MPAPRLDAFLPGRHPLDAYGGGGFRFGDMSHRGSLMIVPSGMRVWNVSDLSEIDEASFAPALAEAAEIEFLLLGTGARLQRLPPALDRSLREASLRVECMDTGAAARTYNILLSEGRKVAAALIAVE